MTSVLRSIHSFDGIILAKWVRVQDKAQNNNKGNVFKLLRNVCPAITKPRAKRAKTKSISGHNRLGDSHFKRSQPRIMLKMRESKVSMKYHCSSNPLKTSEEEPEVFFSDNYK